jgi:hypothetical protein
MFGPNQTFVVGVEPDAETGCLRMYVGHRYKGIYALVEDEAAKEELLRSWAQSYSGHLMTTCPPNENLYTTAERP